MKKIKEQQQNLQQNNLKKMLMTCWKVLTEMDCSKKSRFTQLDGDFLRLAFGFIISHFLQKSHSTCVITLENLKNLLVRSQNSVEIQILSGPSTIYTP